MAAQRITFRLILADGSVAVEVTREGMPRHWKSWLMHQAPYGTDFQGARFEREEA